MASKVDCDMKDGAAKISDIHSVLAPAVQPEDRYVMNKEHHGNCVIINNVEFENRRKRKGSDVDKESLKDIFTKLGFKVKTYDNQKASEIKDIMKQVGKEDHSKNDSFVCAILSHGEENDQIYGVDGKLFVVQDLIDPINAENCKSLMSKPKIFFIQTCRGTNQDQGVERVVFGPALESGRIPLEADFLIFHSVIPGYYSIRNEEKGSWFIQAISRVFNHDKYRKEDLVTMLTEVNRIVALEFETKIDGKPFKQMPCSNSTLTKKVYL